MTTTIRSSVASATNSEHLVNAARGLAPTIRAASADIDRERQLPAHLVDALHEAGMFRLTIPRELGGLETDALTITRIAEELAFSDGSVAWSVLIAGAGIAVLGWLPREVSGRLAGEPHLAIAGTLMPTGQAVAGGDGYRITGRWAFASGIQHASWLFATCILMDGDAPRRNEAGQPVARILVVPAQQAVIQDTWYTAGLRGTGSQHFVLHDVFVPTEMTIDPAPILFGSNASTWHSYPMYRSAALLVTGFGGMQLGIARAALEEFQILAQTKTPWQARQMLREQNRIQAAVARAQAQLEAARTYVHSTIAELWDAVATNGTSTPAQRARTLLAQVYASDTAVEVVDTIAHLAGTSALYTPNRFDQCLRDVRAAASHRMVSPPIYEAAGRVALGLEAATPFF